MPYSLGGKFAIETKVCPKIVNINGNKQNHVTHSYILNKTANNIYSQNLEEAKISFNLPFLKKNSHIYNISSMINTSNKDNIDNDKKYNLNITEILENNKKGNDIKSFPFFIYQYYQSHLLHVLYYLILTLLQNQQQEHEVEKLTEQYALLVLQFEFH